VYHVFFFFSGKLDLPLKTYVYCSGCHPDFLGKNIFFAFPAPSNLHIPNIFRTFAPAIVPSHRILPYICKTLGLNKGGIG